MTRLKDINLIHLFTFYLWMIFLLSTYRRIGQYRSIAALVRAVPSRWPRLFELVRQHGHIFLTWTTVLPGALALALSLLHSFASYYFWPEAGRPPYGLTVERLAQHTAMLACALLIGCAMLAVDGYATFSAGEVDRRLMEQYFDQAEYWLRSWAAPIVRVFTLGYVNPRRMVALEVQKALIEASRLINNTLWWVTAQVSLRIGFGLTLWLAYASDLHT